MKILMISHEYPPVGGGGANACMFLAREYIRQGHEVTILTVNFQGVYAENEMEEGVKVLRVNAKRKYKEHCNFTEMLDFIIKAWPQISKLQKVEKYDACQVFFGIPSGPLGYMLKKRYHVPYIIRFGGGDIPGFQDRFSGVYKLLGPFIKIIWKNADALVANSKGLRRLALAFYDKKEIKIIPNGVDTSFFVPESGKCSDVIEVLFVSRLIERKGLQYILPDWHKVSEKSGRRVHLTIVGDGPYKETLQKIAEDHNLETQVYFAGQKDKSEIVKYYQKADVFILPSKKEGMPNVVLEAMACGLPVVMTPCQGSEELIDQNGSIVEIGDFVEQVAEICRDDLLRERQGKKSLERAVNEFSWKKTAGAYLEILEQI